MVKLKVDLPKGFFKEEIRDGYKISAKMKKVWAVELDMLIEFDRVCRQLGLKYFLDSGTLLGAVSNHKFVPWDDDIDVIMLRKDYDALIRKGATCFKQPYFLQCAYTDKNYFRTHAQLRRSDTAGILLEELRLQKVCFNQGIFIDIFVLDGLTDDVKLLKKQLRELTIIRSQISKIYYYRRDDSIKGFLKWCRSLALRIIHGNGIRLFRKLEHVAKRYSDSQYVDRVAHRSDPEKLYHMKKEWYKDSIECMFEGYSFSVPKAYDEILKEQYGDDYMTPHYSPTAHGKVYFNVDKSYKEVLRHA